jgi:viologen exporter family transport system permease protein
MSAGARSVFGALGALAHAFRLGWSETWEQRGALLGTLVNYAVILSLWANLYRQLRPQTLATASLGYTQVVWYLALTELVALGIGYAFRQIQDEILDGSVTALLVRPVGYVALTAAQEVGRMTAKIAALALPGAVLAYWLTGKAPFGVAVVPALALSVTAGAANLLAMQVLVGLSTAWFGTARPVFFIAQKLMFVLGGLILPLDAYPPVLVKVAWLTPFPAMLYAPASIALDPTWPHVAAMLAVQAFWLGAAWLAIVATSAAFERRYVAGGLAA